MKDTDAVSLYLQAVSVTPGDPTDFGADMWCELLRDLRYEDARTALLNLLRRSTFASPAEIRDEVKRIREKRCEHAAAPVPPSGLSILEDVEWCREYWRRVADGEVPEQGDRGVLVAGPPLRLLGRKVSDEESA
jgi:hypothetical protein